MRHFEIQRGLNLANALYTSAGHYGGASFNRNFERPTTGYMVSILSLGEYPNLSSVNTHLLSQKIDAQLDLKPGDNIYFGSWKDETDGSVHFDVSVVKQSKDAALTMAKTYDQRAIWDVEKKEEIRCHE